MNSFECQVEINRLRNKVNRYDAFIESLLNYRTVHINTPLENLIKTKLTELRQQ